MEGRCVPLMDYSLDVVVGSISFTTPIWFSLISYVTISLVLLLTWLSCSALNALDEGSGGCLSVDLGCCSSNDRINLMSDWIVLMSRERRVASVVGVL